MIAIPYSTPSKTAEAAWPLLRDLTPATSARRWEARSKISTPARILATMKSPSTNDRYLHFAIAAARMALKNAGISWAAGHVRKDIAMVLGTCNGGLLSAEEEYKWLHNKGNKIFDEKMNLQAQYYGMGKALSRALGVGGEMWIVTTACSSTTGAIGLAASLNQRRPLRHGHCRRGADYPMRREHVGL